MCIFSQTIKPGYGLGGNQMANAVIRLRSKIYSGQDVAVMTPIMLRQAIKA